ncbi:MAG TPA: hypothetical protein VF242_04040 [Nitrososphaeraceae archaeon]|jgi:hypothetical protein
MNPNDIDWNDVIKREARGINDEDFGKVQDIHGNYVLVKRGIINKEQFYLPKDQAESYDGMILKFRLSEYDLKTRYKDEPFIKDAESESIESDMNKLEEEIDSQEIEEK